MTTRRLIVVATATGALLAAGWGALMLYAAPTPGPAEPITADVAVRVMGVFAALGAGAGLLAGVAAAGMRSLFTSASSARTSRSRAAETRRE